MPYEYVVGDEKIVMQPDEDLIAVRYREPALHTMRASLASREELGPYEARFEVPGGEKYTIYAVAQSPVPRPQRMRAAMAAMDGEADVARVAPVFKFGNYRVVATDRILVGFAKGAKKIKKTLAGVGGTVLEESGNEYVVQLEETVDPFAAVAELAALDAVEYAEPDFVTIGLHSERRSDVVGGGGGEPGEDPLLNLQYALRNTQALQAWTLGIGDPSIKIAILDEGVDVDHEDLAGVVAGAYDATDDDDVQTPNDWDAHGTACAGLAAAIQSNDLGIRGVGAGCSLLAVRIAFSNAPDQPWVTANSWIKRAIDWAWQNGADVLSNSWGGGPPTTAVINALQRARTQGRSGKGCVIVQAAGNDFGPVSFPANLADVLSISASNEFDEFKTPTSQDHETWWGSNFGPEIDVAAPGVHNYTTDITGNRGYNPIDDGHYFDRFNGTSSATPIVAGAVGLLLSADPELTEDSVRELIRSTADKVGTQPYVDGRNDQMGYGRLNVFRALQTVVKEAKGERAPQRIPVLDNGAARNGHAGSNGHDPVRVPSFATRRWSRSAAEPYAWTAPLAEKPEVPARSMVGPMQGAAGPRVRESATRLVREDPDRLRRFIDAVVQLKHKRRHANAPSIYDEFVALHLGVVGLFVAAGSTLPNFFNLPVPIPGHLNGLATGPAAGIDGAHRNHLFLPWHREYLNRFEQELRAIDPEVTVPYWDWTDHEGTALLFTPEFMGPNGTPNGNFSPVEQGHFAANSFPVRPDLHFTLQLGPPQSFGTSLQRDMMPGGVGPGGCIAFSALAMAPEIFPVFQAATYDALRRALEAGPRLHNFGHRWIGKSMAQMSSPNDPMFWLHHANVDRLWSAWQAVRRQEWEQSNPGATYDYAIHYTQAGDPGGNDPLHWPMWPWDNGASAPARYIPGQEFFIGTMNEYDTVFSTIAVPEQFPLPAFGGDVVKPLDVLDSAGQVNVVYESELAAPAPSPAATLPAITAWFQAPRLPSSLGVGAY